jgi:hypothetical protein
MSDYDRDGNVERQQIHEIALNVARRLLRVLEIGRSAPPALAAEIDATARVISDVQHDVEQVMAMQPFGAALDMSVLTHILGSQQYAVGLLEQLEKRTQGYGTATPVPAAPQAFQPAPQTFAARAGFPAADTFAQPQSYPSSQDFGQQSFAPPSQNYADAQGYADPQRLPAPQPYAAPDPYAAPPGRAPRPAAPEAPRYAPQQAPGFPQPGMYPNGQFNGAPAQTGPAPYYSGAPTQNARENPRDPAPRGAQQPRQAQPQPAPRQRPPGAAPAPRAAKGAFSMPDFAALGARMSEPKFAAAAATLVVVTSSLIGAFTLLPGPSAEKQRNVAPGQKLDGRLDTDIAAPSVHRTPAQQFAAVAPDPNSMEQPYLVVLATRASTEELQKDFQGFNTAYPDLLGGRKARVDRIQGQDQKTWHRLSLIPPQSHAEAKDLCAKLKAAGLTGCWIRRVPLSK